MDDKFVVTGVGIISAIGNNADETLCSLLSKRSGIEELRYLKTSHNEFPVGEVKMTNEEMESELSLDPSTVTTRTALMGMIALEEALHNAGMDPCLFESEKIAFISGTTVGGMDRSEQYYLDFLNGDNHKEYIATHDCGACTEMIASRGGNFSIVATPSTACSSVANSILLGINLLRTGRADIVVAGGSECITKFHLNGFNSLMILDHNRCRPFDRDRAGLNLGEGAAYLVIETYSHAKKRGAKPLVAISGWGNACDAFHQTASSENGEGAYRAMCVALQRSGLAPEAIDYINAHGTGTRNNDQSETAAMRRIFGINVPPVSSTKSATGHTTSASGAIESVITILAMKHNFLPVNLGFQNPIDGGIIPVVDTMEGTVINHALCNSFGFGGNDTSILFSNIGEIPSERPLNL